MARRKRSPGVDVAKPHSPDGVSRPVPSRCRALRMCPVQPVPMRRTPARLWSGSLTERLPALTGTLWFLLVKTDRLYKAYVGAGAPLFLWRGE